MGFPGSPLPHRLREGSRLNREVATRLFVLVLSAGLAGCSGGLPHLGLPHLGTPVADYVASNILSPAGYDQSKIDDTHYRVKAQGTEATPKERVEKIARARAAQIGVEEHLAYFKVTSVEHGFACNKKQVGYKSEDTPASRRPTVVLDVVYAKDAVDPGFVGSKETFDALSSEIANEVVAPDAKAVATQETRAGCGAG
jgi:hypothetical protein